ncbi:hypothetical protein HOU03_gp283 [Caulobacter phage CcrSC]|uniref:Lipoprotein n=1 Tax=Caulobacter phage CcrSC TaxID=2283272 RepID=A0A385EFX2_9CAUD|nr:hypothetical protein HOU03_gp283 [Caulobacter phage CcrSC]AXQ69985.1 hypothetical protein CcrSC_gp403 [Caulobacter phage CcrSC]
MNRALPLLALCALGLTACLDPKTKAAIKANQEAQAREYEAQQARYQRDVDYLYRTKVVRVCTAKSTYIVQGADGRRWVSNGPNPGQSWMAIRDTAGHTNPWVTVDPVSSDIALTDICQ